MIIDKKVHLNNLGIILGTGCNLKCNHCMGGDPDPMKLDLKYVDNIIDNVTGIDSLAFIGYEISLYVDLLKSVLNKFIEKNVKINKLQFYTNAKIYSEELADVFNWFSEEHTTKPHEAFFQISTDVFHLKGGLRVTELYDNIDKYKEKIKNIDITKWDLSTDLIIKGRAKTLKVDEIKHISKVRIPDERSGRFSFEFREKCSGGMNTCNGGNCICNCIVNPVILIPNGYVFITDTSAFSALAEKDYSLAFGKIDETSLYDMVINYKKLEDQGLPIIEDIIFQNLDDLWWCANRDMVFPYISYREKMIDAIYKQDSLSFWKIAQSAETLIKVQDSRLAGKQADEVRGLAYRSIYKALKKDLKELNRIAWKHFEYPNSISQRSITHRQIMNLPLSPNNMFKSIGYEYEEFVSLWSAYYNSDYDECARILIEHRDRMDSILEQNLILRENKTRTE